MPFGLQILQRTFGYVQKVKILTPDQLSQVFDLLPKRDLRFLLRHPAVYDHVHDQLNDVDTKSPRLIADDESLR